MNNIISSIDITILSSNIILDGDQVFESINALWTRFQSKNDSYKRECGKEFKTEIKSICKGKSDSKMKKNSSGPSTKGGKNDFEIEIA